VDLVWNAILATKARNDDTSSDVDESGNGNIDDDDNLGTKVGDSSLSWQDRLNSIFANTSEDEESGNHITVAVAEDVKTHALNNDLVK
jgi:hypothetical protein